MGNEILSEIGDYGVITLNRPEKRNAISTSMGKQLLVAIKNMKKSDIKFLVITNNGEDYFCAGGDLNDLGGDLNPDQAFASLKLMREVNYEIASFPVPTIALLQGNAIGGGCEIATACDIRIAREGTSFGFIQSSIGILPGWGGGALLYKKINSSFALQWITEGEIYQANDLLHKGWLHRIIPTKKWNEKTEILKKYIAKSKEQMLYLKAQYLEAIDLPSLANKMEQESKNSASLWDSEEHILAVERFLKK